MHITIHDIVPSLAMLENGLWLNRALVSWMRHFSNSTKTYEAVFLCSFSDSFLYCVTSFSRYSRSQGTLNSSFYVVPTCTCFNYSNLIARCVWYQLEFPLPKQPSVPQIRLSDKKNEMEKKVMGVSRKLADIRHLWEHTICTEMRYKCNLQLVLLNHTLN